MGRVMDRYVGESLELILAHAVEHANAIETLAEGETLLDGQIRIACLRGHSTDLDRDVWVLSVCKPTMAGEDRQWVPVAVIDETLIEGMAPPPGMTKGREAV